MASDEESADPLFLLNSDSSLSLRMTDSQNRSLKDPTLVVNPTYVSEKLLRLHPNQQLPDSLYWGNEQFDATECMSTDTNSYRVLLHSTILRDLCILKKPVKFRLLSPEKSRLRVGSGRKRLH